MTKIGQKRIHPVRVRGGATKFRALRLDTGNFSWGTEGITRKTRILGVSYSAANLEYVRTNTLVKSNVVQIDATPFRQAYEQKYGLTLGKKKRADEKKAAAAGAAAAGAEAAEEKKKSARVLAKQRARREALQVEPHVEEQFVAGRLFAAISSRPGQSGRADGYILEGPELDFYLKKMQKKKEKKEGGKA